MQAKQWLWWAAVALVSLPLLPRGALAAQPYPVPADGDLAALVATLRQRGFQVRFEPPPARGAYGQFVPASRTLWVSPLAFELGIGRQTVIHEAVHAAQSCPGGPLAPIGWRFSLVPAVERQIAYLLTSSYHHGSLVLEREAFGMQGQPDAVERVIAALRQRCPAPGARRAVPKPSATHGLHHQPHRTGA